MSIVEKMARAIYEAGGFEYVSRTVFPGGGTPYGQWAVAVEQARAALTATGLTEAQLEGLANGTMACVPVEKNDASGEWVAVRVEDTCDGLMINQDDAKKHGIEQDVWLRTQVLTDTTARGFVPSSCAMLAAKEG